MEDGKQTYYVDLVSGDVLAQQLSGENASFRVFATDEELAELRQCLEKAHSSDLKAYARSHVPYELYHHDRGNDQYDESMVELYRMIHELGDDEAKKHIEEMGILEYQYDSNEKTEKFK
ncbi:hydrolase [Bacillus massiliglaciei]|uniref:hydrolase n=1 Tax=Bacillus massiliglaciei TaxID=1816693 RepID=UPI000DA61B3F|nr:hydrolase [Bacillus massiliglaciei]